MKMGLKVRGLASWREYVHFSRSTVNVVQFYDLAQPYRIAGH